MCGEPIQNTDLEQKIDQKSLHCDSAVNNVSFVQIYYIVTEKF